jgi:osmotically-inducible protein OsmY
MLRKKHKDVPGPGAGLLRHLKATTVVASLCLYLAGCVAAAVGTAVVVSVDVARDRRSVGAYVDDNSVEVKIRRAIKRDPQIGDGAYIGVTSMNGIVLLTGQVASHEQERRAVGISRGYTEAREVINQLSIGERPSLSARNGDAWITTKVKSALLASRHVSAGRVKVVTESATVYLMGLVSRAEADAAVESARGIRGVQRIVKVFEYI